MVTDEILIKLYLLLCYSELIKFATYLLVFTESYYLEKKNKKQINKQKNRAGYHVKLEYKVSKKIYL